MEIQDLKQSLPEKEQCEAPPQLPSTSTRRTTYAPSKLGRFVKVALTASAAYLLLDSWFLPRWQLAREGAAVPYAEWPAKYTPLEELESIMMETPNEDSIREWSKYYTAGPHLAGKNLSQAIWTKEKWESYGIPSEIVAYEIYTNYPVSHRLALLNSTAKADDALLFEASLEEDELDEDPTSKLEDKIPTFHGYSANGNVTAEYIFANYGTYRDFEDLTKKGINMTGKVIICRYGKIFRGLKVKRAQDLGAIGVLIYSDPGDDGNITALNGYDEYPAGPARHPSSVQRGSVQFLSIGPGDPTTPGYASKPGVPRVDPNGTIPSIPSLPISYTDALPLLKALNGYGLNASELGGDWAEGGLWHKGVNYNIGPAPGLVVNLVNEVEYEITPQWDVIGVINGSISDETIIIGNHRDAWIAGGAGDPNSGSAALIELARSFGEMLKTGWKPLRTLVLASWDGEEYGLLGSTEWVEDYHSWLHTHALAYLNVDVGARGPIFQASGNPLLNDVLYKATQKVADPKSLETTEAKSVYDNWNKHISTLGSGSDYTAFQDFLGIPSVDMGFGSAGDSPVYHYHSNYDSFAWMDKFGDPGFKYHAAITKVWGLMALDLLENPVVNFNMTSYAQGLSQYLDKVKSLAAEAGVEVECDHGKHKHPKHPKHDPKREFVHGIHKLEKRLHHLQYKAAHFDAHAARLAAELQAEIPWWNWWKKARLYVQIRHANQAMKYFDRSFVYPHGLDDRPLFKHVVYAPGKWTGYAGDTFPGLVESINEGNWTNAAKWSRIIDTTVVIGLHLI